MFSRQATKPSTFFQTLEEIGQKVPTIGNFFPNCGKIRVNPCHPWLNFAEPVPVASFGKAESTFVIAQVQTLENAVRIPRLRLTFRLSTFDYNAARMALKVWLGRMAALASAMSGR